MRKPELYNLLLTGLVGLCGGLLLTGLTRLPVTESYSRFGYYPLMAGLALSTAGLALMLVVVRRSNHAHNRGHQQRQRILANLSEAVVEFDKQHIIRGWNAAAERMYGYSAAQAIGRNGKDVLKTEVLTDTYLNLIETVNETGYWHGEFVQYHQDGTALRTAANLIALYNEQGNIRGYTALMLEITEQHETRQRLQLNEARLDAFIGSAQLAMLVVNKHCKVTFAGGRDLSRVVSAAQPEGQPVHALFPPANQQQIRQHVLEALDGHSITTIIEVDPCVFGVRFSPIYCGDGTIGHAALVVTDITEHQYMDTMLQRYAIRLETLRVIDEAVLASATPCEIATVALDYLPFLLPHIVAALFTYDASTGWHPTAFHDTLHRVQMARLERVMPGVLGTLAPTDAAQHTVSIKEAGSPVEYLFNDLGLPFVQVVPLMYMQETIGVLLLGVSQEQALNDEQLQFLQEVAHTLALALQHANLNQQVKSYAAKLESNMLQVMNKEYLTQSRSEAILDSISDAVIFTDATGTIRQVNPALTLMFGYGDGDVIGQDVTALACKLEQPRLRQVIDEVLAEDTPQRLELTMKNQAGGVFTADIAIAAIKDIYSSLGGLVLNLRDVTENRRIEENLRRSLEAERELGELRSRFVSTVSHEFRTPLTVIGSSTQLIEMYAEANGNADIARHIGRIQDSIGVMESMLNDVTTLQKNQHRATVAMAPLDLVALTRTAIADIQFATQSRHHIHLHITGTPIPLLASKGSINHIATNLITNAVKYSPEESTIDVEIAYNENKVALTVVNQGEPIAPAEMDNLFEPFYRASNAGTRPGTGLGLSIVKQAVDSHQGTIEAFSNERKGTCFRVTLPLHHELVGEYEEGQTT